MTDRLAVRRVFSLACLVGLAGLWSADADAAGTKVPNGADLKKKVSSLYNGDVDPASSGEREKAILEVEKILNKDAKNIALKTPEFWVEAIQEGRFAGTKRSMGKTNKVATEDVECNGKDGKPGKAKLWFHGGAMVNKSKPAPLMVSILEKGVDPKAYIETTWVANDEMKKEWVIVAMVEGDDFPVTTNTDLILRPFQEIIQDFNIDSNRWYLEGVGAACAPVQLAAENVLSQRLAGMILRSPKKAVTNTNSVLYPSAVMHGATDAESKAAADVYLKLDDKNNKTIELPDLPSVNAANADLLGWLAAHPRRVLPTSYSFVTTLTETSGEAWTGFLNIEAPLKRGEPTKLTVKYLRDSNTVDVQCENLGEFVLFMNDDLLDLDKEVAIFVNGTMLKKQTFERRLRDMFETADGFGEWGRVFTARYRGSVPSKIVAPPPAPPANPDPTQPTPPAEQPKEPPKDPAPTPPSPSNPK